MKTKAPKAKSARAAMKIKAPKAESAHMVAHIDDGLLTEILRHLPVKSLTRFKTVSKNWHSLITDPRFLRRHKPNPNPAAGLFLAHSTNFSWTNDYSFVYVPFFPKNSAITQFAELGFAKDPSRVRIRHSCNGLLLCSIFKNNTSTIHYVYNPTTNRYSALPKLDGTLARSKEISGMSLAFDPAKSPHYKVVCVVFDKNMASGDIQYQLLVYSSGETGGWRIIGEPFIVHADFRDGVYWNDAIHWMGYGIGDSLYFNIHSHMLKKMPNSPIDDACYGNRDYFFGESCGHLHYVHIWGSQIKFNVYEMKRDYSDWFVKYRVDLSLVVDANPGMKLEMCDPTNWFYYRFYIISIVRDEEEDDSFLVLRIPGKAIRYNLVSMTFEELHELEGADIERSLSFPLRKSSFQYIESLYCF